MHKLLNGALWCFASMVFLVAVWQQVINAQRYMYAISIFHVFLGRMGQSIPRPKCSIGSNEVCRATALLQEALVIDFPIHTRNKWNIFISVIYPEPKKNQASHIIFWLHVYFRDISWTKEEPGESYHYLTTCLFPWYILKQTSLVSTNVYWNIDFTLNH